MSNKKPLIAYIEDDAMLLTMYEQLFTIHGFSFVGARDFESGAKMIKEKNPDVILLDMLLPDKMKWVPTELNVSYGLDLLSEIKKNPATKNTPVIILSNMDESAIVNEAKERGADDYMIKAHVLPKEVLAKVREILGARGIEIPCDPIKEK
ncbi:MAG: hypothetical protein COU72_04725, partial [Parcubacteria group bacterium CG10_big_fil_rev_8_21_14_0_10_41_35]